ncbi:MAG: rhodanese-like domain-containing protein [Micavibrio sp.]|nr:rhodanese-like domain-containing protein [Micavibrio sp.]
MPRFIPLMLLICLCFAGVAAKANKVAAPAPNVTAPMPLPLAQGLTPDQFKAALPTNAEELDLTAFKALEAKGKVVVLDLRSPAHYAARHLKGAVNAPLTDLTETTLPTLVPDKDTPVVLTCDYSFMPTRMVPMTLQAYPVLKAAGYKTIYRLNLWRDASNAAMLSDAAQEQQLPFEGTDVKKP